jgi:hypothetical protein
LPDEIEHISMHLRYRGQWVNLEIAQDELVVRVDPGEGTVMIGFDGRVAEVVAGSSTCFDLSSG